MCKGIFKSEGRQLRAKGEEREKIQRRALRKWNKRRTSAGWKELKE